VPLLPEDEIDEASAPDHDDEQVAGRPGRSLWLRIAGAVAALALLAAGGAAAGRWYFIATPAAAATGTVFITSAPSGATAFVGGEPRGMTPLTLSLPAGVQVIELRGEGEPRSITVDLASGAQVAQHVELPAALANVGGLQVRTDPAGATVRVDGVGYGVSPTVVAGLAPGLHEVVLTGDVGSITHEVTIEAGVTASLDVPLSVPASVPASGWLSVASPIEVQIFEGDRLLGTNLSEKLPLSVGRHQVDLVNEALGYRTSRVVEVGAGKTAALAVDPPRSTLSLNAVPWADVWVDDERVGETPLGNLSLPIGSHEVVFRHPDLGEQKHRVNVTLTEPARLSVDMRTP
jgi:hypothetical protein